MPARQPVVHRAQVCLGPAEPDAGRPASGSPVSRASRRHRERADAVVELPWRAFEIWDHDSNTWSFVKGSYEVAAGRSIADRRVTVTINV
ncbi:fibronectin type III-like domain-contianing protein [Streptomyces chiangmaiensis]|uniref:Fibronectin type III-like domain-contianing protein n=1 Tax=Streptomyces chiangmaiensis TaxID=766497 RepID=A0ABU7FGC6_9ACTN|nr:fibronectin type III-like domain-contianing protein [Streptomyces chiangmaiensis]MED7823182.1 fibronectin type III-like domain-contianing protein [Streptomyces chiangmaiensis]